MVGKTKWKPLKLPLPKKVVNQQEHIPRGVAEISATIKNLKNAEMMSPITSISTSLFDLYKRQMDLGE